MEVDAKRTEGLVLVCRGRARWRRYSYSVSLVALGNARIRPDLRFLMFGVSLHSSVQRTLPGEWNASWQVNIAIPRDPLRDRDVPVHGSGAFCLIACRLDSHDRCQPVKNMTSRGLGPVQSLRHHATIRPRKNVSIVWRVVLTQQSAGQLTISPIPSATRFMTT